MKLIELKDITFGYGERPVIENVSLDIFYGDYILVLGPNGGGKTTLLKIILGMIKPWKGSIKYYGDIESRLGYVPQSSSFNKNFPITVSEMVLTGAINAGNYRRRPGRDDCEKARMILEKLQLDDKRDENINDLSGGQLQRLLIGRALASNPAVLFLDEPITSIDHPSQLSLIDFLNELREQMTIVIVTHDPTPFAKTYNHIACMNGRLHYHDKGELEAGELEQVYGCPVELLGHGIPHTILNKH